MAKEFETECTERQPDGSDGYDKDQLVDGNITYIDLHNVNVLEDVDGTSSEELSESEYSIWIHIDRSEAIKLIKELAIALEDLEGDLDIGLAANVYFRRFKIESGKYLGQLE